MKISLIPFLLLLGLTFTFEGPVNTEELPNLDTPIELTCEGELCSCIAAGGCETASSSTCRIEFCSGHVESESFNSKPSNITVIQQPCPEIEEN